LKSAIRECEVIFHLGALGSVPRSIKNPVATFTANTVGTSNVLEVARESGAHVIFCSSSSVYGRNLQLPKVETMWLGPMTPYAASKLAGEAYLQAYGSSYQIPTTILRLFNVFGPKQRPNHEYAAVLPRWIWLAMRGQPIQVFGDGTVSRDFTYIDTVLEVAMTAMEQKIVSEGVINLAYGNRITLNEIINLLKIYFPNLEVIYTDDRVGDVKESQNSPTLIRNLFPDITPRLFEDALFETINWFKEFENSLADELKTSK
jgi:UDP-glucose 4-epimerase